MYEWTVGTEAFSCKNYKYGTCFKTAGVVNYINIKPQLHSGFKIEGVISACNHWGTHSSCWSIVAL